MTDHYEMPHARADECPHAGVGKACRPCRDRFERAPITPDERAAMRERAEQLHHYGGESQEASEDVPRLLDALDTAEAEAARATDAARLYGRIVEQQCIDITKITRSEHLVTEDGDADWGAIWDRGFELAARAEKAEAEVARLTPPCDGGCSYGDGPAEECSAHGRPVAEVWGIVTEVRRQRDEARAEVARLREEAARCVADEAAESDLTITRQRDRLRAREEQVRRLRAEVTRLHALVADLRAARPAPVWDEDTVCEEVAGILRDYPSGYAADRCACWWAYTGLDGDLDQHVATHALAVVRRHLPVRPDRETLIEAMSAALHITTDRIPGLNPGPALSADTASVVVAADAVLAEWPGESRAQVQAEALRDAATQLVAEDNTGGDWWDSDGQTYVTPIEWLRARADRLDPKEK